jgi:microtubule-associated protein-like 6
MKFKGHSSFIAVLDFSADSRFIQSNSGNGELMFWDCHTGQQVTTVTEMRDVRWATFKCILGWPVQGLWPSGVDTAYVNCVDRSSDGEYVVSGDDRSMVKLFKYPSPREGAQFRAYRGHADDVMSVRFSNDDNYVFSVGGADKAILQFQLIRQKRSHLKS